MQRKLITITSSSSLPASTQKTVSNCSKIASSSPAVSSDIQLNGNRSEKLTTQRVTASPSATATKTPEIKSKVLSTRALRISHLFLTNVYRIILLILIGCPGFNNGEFI